MKEADELPINPLPASTMEKREIKKVRIRIRGGDCCHDFKPTF